MHVELGLDKIVAAKALAPKSQVINMVYSIYDIKRCEWISYRNKSIFKFYFYDLIHQHFNDIMIHVSGLFIPQN